MFDLSNESEKLEQENKRMTLDIKQLKEENAANLGKVNRYSDSLKKMKKESNTNLNEFEEYILIL